MARMMKKQTNKQDIPRATQESFYMDVAQTLQDIWRKISLIFDQRTVHVNISLYKTILLHK